MSKELHNKELIEDNLRLNQELLKAELRIAELERIANLHELPNESEEDYVVVFDSEMRFVHISKIDYGFQLSDFIGKKIDEIFPKDLTDIFATHFEEAKLNGKSNTYFSSFDSPNGKVTQRNQIREITINGGKYYLTRAENVTNSYGKYIQLQDKEDLTNLALEATHTGTWSFSKLSMLFVISQTLRNILEHNSDLLDIPSFLSYIHPDDVARVTKTVEEALSGINPSTEVSYRILLPNGNLKYLSTTLKGVPNNDDEIINFNGITQDITDTYIKNKTEFQYQSLVQSINTNLKAGLYRSTPESGGIFCNKAMWEMFGFNSLEEFTKATPLSLYKNIEDRNVEMSDLEKKYALNNIYTSKEIEYLRKDGTSFTAIVNSVLQKDEEGNFFFDGAVHDITQMKNVENNLKKQELIFSSLLQNSLDVFSIYDKDGRGIFHSNRLYEVLGYNKEEILNTGFWNYIHKEDLTNLIAKFKALIQVNNSTEEFLVRIIRKSGETIYFEGIAKNMLNTEGINGVVVNGREVTDRILNEIELKEQQSRMRAILDTTENTYVLINKDGIVISYNKRMYEETFAFFNIEIINNVTHYNEFVLPNKVNEFHKNYTNALNGKSVNVVRRIIGPDNSNYWFSFAFKPAYDNNDEIYAVSLSTLNVTSLKENEDKLQLSLFEIEALINAIPDTIIRINIDLTILDFKAGSKFESYSPNVLIGGNLDSLGLPAYAVEDLKSAISSAISNNSVEIVEFNISDEYNESNYFEARIVANAENTIIAIIRDITDRKKFEYRMKALNSELEIKIQERTSKLGEAIVDLSTEIDSRITAQKEAENAKELLQISLDKEKVLNDMKTKFVAMVSHEYRTPLTIIQTSAFLLEKYYVKQNEQRFFSNLEKVHKSVASMVDMLENVLSYSKLESGNIQRRLTKLNVKDVCEAIALQYRSTVTKGLHRINTKVEDNNTIIISDQNLLNQILSNLVFNSIKYSPEGGDIDIIVTEGKHSIAFSVKDQGIGIPKEDISKLSLPFQRGGNVKDIAGTGLGLSIVKAWTEILDGEIKIESKLGKGTIFTVILPRNYKNI